MASETTNPKMAIPRMTPATHPEVPKKLLFSSIHMQFMHLIIKHCRHDGQILTIVVR